MLRKNARSQSLITPVNKNSNLKVVDFFCGGGGMSYGMQLAGLNVIAGIDYEPSCKDTYEANIKGARFIQADVFELKEKALKEELMLEKNDQNLVLIGCSPCQFWSIINTDKTKSQKSKNLLVEFQRFVKYFNPGYVIVENVPGVLRKKRESGLESFIAWLEGHNYKVHFDVHNVSDFNVPQNRKRFTLIANRVTNRELSPIKSDDNKITVADVLGERNGFPKIADGNMDSTPFKHTTAGLSNLNKRRLEYVKADGGDRLGFAKYKDLQVSCFVGKDDSFRDSYSRLWWNRQSPTITTKFFSISNGRFVHPEENRALSLREGAVLQSFPKSYKFEGTSLASIARLIGNAVPPEYAKRIGLALINNI